MKIWIVGSWFDMFPLISLLNKFDVDVHFFIDWKCWPWWDKSTSLRDQRTKLWCEYLESIWVDYIIVPPCLEFKAKDWTEVSVLPLFQDYFHKFVAKYSLVWKLWLLCDQVDINHAEDFMNDIGKKYKLSDAQLSTKKFHQPFVYRKKNVRMWMYFLTTYGKREPMVRKTLKHDLRYFHDASVDTLVPMSRWYLFYEKLITQRTNWKKIRFHWWDSLQFCLEELLNITKWSSYQLTLHATDESLTLLQEKKWSSVLSKWWEVSVKTIKVED